MEDKKEFLRRGSYGKETKRINKEILDVGLVTAINMADLDSVVDFIEKKKVDMKLGGDHKPALIIASIEGQIEIAKYLIQQGADVNVLDDEDNLSPLHHAVESGNVDMINLLSKHGAKLDIKGSVDDWTPLHEASQHPRLDILQLLVKNGAKFTREKDGMTCLHIATSMGHVENVKFLIENGNDVNETYGYDGETALILAAGLVHFDIVKILVENGAKVNKCTLRDKEAPIHIAAGMNNIKMATFLLENGADANAKMSNNLTPLDIAEQRTSQNMINLLLQKGASRFHSAHARCMKCPSSLSSNDFMKLTPQPQSSASLKTKK